MFKIFKKPEDDERARAVAAYEKAVSLTSDGHEARSLRLRMSMLCRAHLDKTFVAGAQAMEAYEAACMVAIQQAKPQPDPPQAALFQSVKSTAGEVQVYLPQEYADEAFAIGMLYQKTELSAEQAIEAAQRLADRIAYDALKLTAPFTALQFLRDELAAEAEAQAEAEDGEAQEGGDAPAEPKP
ncbi:MAG: hypothetical protein RI884_2581 [Pseudomonadota bacterium]|jgi:hypothetical protein